MKNEDALLEVLSELIQVNSRIVQTIRRIARDSGSGDSLASRRTLGVLQRSGPLRLGVLAEASQVAQPTMTKLVAGLVEKGWVERLPDADDARAWRIGITSAGRADLAEWRTGVASVLLPYFDGLGDAELEALRSTVRLLDQRTAAFDPTQQTQEVAH